MPEPSAPDVVWTEKSEQTKSTVPAVTAAATRRFDPDHFDRFAAFVVDPQAGCVEFVAWNATLDRNGRIAKDDRYRGTIGCCTDKVDRLKDFAKQQGGQSVYATFNPLRRDLLALRSRPGKVNKGEAACDEDVVCLRFFLVKVRHDRKAGVSATGEEVAATLAVRDRILDEHPELKANALWGCSGNGAYVLVRIPEYPNDAEHVGLVKAVLDRLAGGYGR
jgi:hypothetical protein